ncbi:Antitoxin igA-2 [Aquisphaera giovannonii]|uniref:Antitoxin igA-2 n=1 Tax=Aquisphaera giovannonii TaxID=406548 RepID=A0A5B9W3E7_9BACT|nr:helix-turn-helix domain-containing protein [Aquisphaera giovannonii]QEH35112.1 Antitoxin igA-2 [Aquisphaera giovannonii]
MKSPKVRRPLAERLKTSLEEAIQHARDEITLKVTVVELPDEPPEIDAPTLVAIRDQSRMSQAVFARLLNVSSKTVQSWEQGLRTPSHAARRLIQIYIQHPEAVCQTVGLPPVKLQGVTIEKEATGRHRIVVRGAGTVLKAKAPRPKPAR